MPYKSQQSISKQFGEVCQYSRPPASSSAPTVGHLAQPPNQSGQTIGQNIAFYVGRLSAIGVVNAPNQLFHSIIASVHIAALLTNLDISDLIY